MNANPSCETATERSWLVIALEKIAEEGPEEPIFVEYRPDKQSISRREFLAGSKQIAQMLKQQGVHRGSRLFVDIDMKMHWEAFGVWMACQMLGAVCFVWPPDMRYRFAQAETEEGDAENGCATIVVCAGRERVKKWIETDAKNGIGGRTIISLNVPENAGDTIIDFNRYSSFEPLEAAEECGDEATFVYTQGSHQDARKVALSLAHIKAQCEELNGIFDFESNRGVAIDLTSIQTAALTLFAACIRYGNVLICRSENRGMLSILQETEAALAFCLPTTHRQIVLCIQNAGKSCAKTSRGIGLKLAKYRQRNPASCFAGFIKKTCVEPIRNRSLPKLKAAVSYGNHFNTKVAELYSFIEIPVYNAYTVAEFGFVHVHAFMGGGGFLKTIEARVKGGILSVKVRGSSAAPTCMNDLVFEDDRAGLCTHRPHQIALLDGKTVDVASTRECIRQAPLVEDIFIFGDQRPYLTALIYLNRKVLQDWAAEHRISGAFDELAQNPVVYQAVRAIVEKSNLRRSARESIQKFAILKKTLSEDPRIQTPCALTRIPDIARRYAPLVDSFYRETF